MSRTETHIEDWLMRIRAEYLEVPGLSLTKSQVERWWTERYVMTAQRQR